MNKTRIKLYALLCLLAILLSVFFDTGISVHAQSIDYLNTMEPKGVLKDSGSSSYSAVTASGAISGKSGASYDNGIRVLFTRDSDDGASFVTLTYEVKNTANKFEAYVDLDNSSENKTNYAVKLEVFSDENAVFTQILTPASTYPVKIEADIVGAKEVTVRLGDTAPNEDKTAFVLGNAAICEHGASVPAVTVPEQNQNGGDQNGSGQGGTQNQENTSTTDISANAQELLRKSKSYLGHNYLYVTMQFSWQQAATWCEMQGGYLATIGSETENKFIADYLRSLGNKSAYLGMSNSGADGDFQWQNGETALYMNWGRQEADTDGKTYMMMGNGSDEWTTGKAIGSHISFIIEWGDKAPLSENNNGKVQKAVIVIAGLGGSMLSDSSTNALWANKSGVYTELNLSNVAANKTTVKIAGSDYGTADTYKTLLERAAETCSDSDVVFYEWDWRYSAADAVSGLEKLIKDGGWSEVSLIGHNTGGLVACYYIDKNGADSVSKLITLGTPFYGTEKAFYILKSGMLSQGADAVRGNLNKSTASLPALYSLVPEKPGVGGISFTGKMTNALSRKDALENVGVQSSHIKETDSAALKDVYDLIQSGEFGGAYIVAGTGVPTIEYSVVEDGEISRVVTSFNGDGLTGLDSAAMNFKSARPPYIIEETGTAELAAAEDSITLVCNILSGKADNSGFADGVSKEITRTAQKTENKPVEINVSGDVDLTVQTDDQTIILSENRFSFSGNAQSALMYGDSVKSVLVSDESAKINLEILGGNVWIEISGENGTKTWSEIEAAPGAKLKGTAGSSVLEVILDPGNSGIKEVAADTAPDFEAADDSVVSGTDAAEENEDFAWNVWVCIGLVVAAAAVALIMMPYFAYRVSKVETDRKKRMLKQSLRQQRQQNAGMAGQFGAMPQGMMQENQPYPIIQDGMTPFGTDAVFGENMIGGDPNIDYEIMNDSR